MTINTNKLKYFLKNVNNLLIFTIQGDPQIHSFSSSNPLKDLALSHLVIRRFGTILDCFKQFNIFSTDSHSLLVKLTF